MSLTLTFVSLYLCLDQDVQLQMVEICDNAIDDDDDGLIDLNDDDCTCIIIEPVSLIPNPSFEDMNCCPNNRSQLNCADVWIQASEPTTDYIHNCGWGGWDNLPPPRPFPDGEGIVGFRDGRQGGNGNGNGNGSQNDDQLNWKEYAGACLLSPLLAKDSYRFEFQVGFIDIFTSPSINITFFGTTDCVNLPFGRGDAMLGCPTNGPNWVRLGSTLISSNPNSWKKGFIEVTPMEDITAIAIGPACAPTRASTNTYYFFDELILADSKSFQFNISEINHPCADDFRLSILEENNRDYQWYKDGIALLTETNHELSQIYGEGEYQVRIINDGSCNLVKPYQHTVPIIYKSISEIICKDDIYIFGTEELTESGSYTQTFKNQFNCDSVVGLVLDVRAPLYDTVQAKIFEGETYDIQDYSFNLSGEYEAPLFSEVGCDSLVHLDLAYYELYFPNAFSPNEDGVNDVFTVEGSEDLIVTTGIIIFDRWGTQLYSADNSDGEESTLNWDGRIDGNYVQPGVYTYSISVVMDDGQERRYMGLVSVVR